MWYLPAMKNTILDDLIKTSHIPIRFIEMENDFYGCYYHRGKFFSYDKELDIPRIEIRDSLKNYQKIATIIHEKAHSICDKKNCSCLKNPNRKYREIHAYIYELKWLLKYKQKKGLRWLINRLIDYADDNSDYYSKAAQHIIKTKLWQKCLKYIGKL